MVSSLNLQVKNRNEITKQEGNGVIAKLLLALARLMKKDFSLNLGCRRILNESKFMHVFGKKNIPQSYISIISFHSTLFVL